MTIPKRTSFPMCGMNVAFDRELIGRAMYFGLMASWVMVSLLDATMTCRMAGAYRFILGFFYKFFA